MSTKPSYLRIAPGSGDSVAALLDHFEGTIRVEHLPRAVHERAECLKQQFLQAIGRLLENEYAEPSTAAKAEIVVETTQVLPQSKRGQGHVHDDVSEDKSISSPVTQGKDYAALYQSLVDATHRFKAEIARQLEPALNAVVRSMPCSTLQDKQDIAVWVNQQARDLGLAVKSEKTQSPGVLFADLKDRQSNAARFRIDARGDDGRKVRSFLSYDLPYLELIEDAPRRETFVEQARRRRESRSRGADRGVA